MNAIKLTPSLIAACAEKRHGGLSLREIASWVSAKHGVSVSHIAIKNALDKRDARGATQEPQGESASPPARRDASAPEEQDASAPGTDGPTADKYDAMLAELDADIASVRHEGAMQALAQLMRLRADIVERRHKLRPPIVAEADAELIDAGRRAEDKLFRLLDLELAKAPA